MATSLKRSLMAQKTQAVKRSVKPTVYSDYLNHSGGKNESESEQSLTAQKNCVRTTTVSTVQ